MCNLILVDPSTIQSSEADGDEAQQLQLAGGVEMLCFAPTADALPHLRQPGDIIRLHRVKARPPPRTPPHLPTYPWARPRAARLRGVGLPPARFASTPL